MNHWRGLYTTYRHLEQLSYRISDLASDRSPDTHQQRERQNYIDQYKRYLDCYDMQRYSDHVSDLTIQRSGGDDLSLLTEIVLRKKNHKLFSSEPDHNYSQADHHNQSASKSAGVNGLSTVPIIQENESSLSQVNEG